MNLSTPRMLRAAAGLLIAVTTLVVPNSASAAVIDGAVINIQTTPTNPGIYDPVRTTIDWRVPNGTRSGDTFTVELPAALVSFPPGFDLLTPGGVVVATVVIAGDPAVATFTMTDFAENNRGVTGDAFVESSLRDLSLAGTEIDLSYTVNGDLEFINTIEVPPFEGIGRLSSRKTGSFTNGADQCRTSVEDCINWSIESALGPHDVVTFEDISATNATFNCDTLELYFFTVDEQGGLAIRRTAASLGSSFTQTCTPSSFTVTTGPVPTGYLARVRVRATPDVANPDGGVEYPNTAVVTSAIEGRDLRTEEIGTTLRSSTFGGSGSGDNITIEKVDTDGNDADTADEAVVLDDGTASIDYTIVNTGTTNLLDIVVGDVVVSGGTVSGLTCDFSAASPGAPTTGTTWDGPFAPGESFACTAELTGVTSDTPHENVASVTGVGEVSGQPLDDDDPYHAIVNPPPTTTTTTTLPPTTTTTTTTTLPPTTTTTTTTTTVAPIPTITIPPTVTLPETGGSGGPALAAFGALLVGLGFAARRFGRPAADA